MYPARNLRSLRKTAARALPLDGRGREAPKNLHHPQCPRRRPLSPHTPCLTLGGDPRLPDHLVGDMGEGGLPPPPELAGDLVQQPPPPPPPPHLRGFWYSTLPPPPPRRRPGVSSGRFGRGGEGQHAKSRVLEGQVRFCGSLSSEKNRLDPPLRIHRGMGSERQIYNAFYPHSEGCCS